MSLVLASRRDRVRRAGVCGVAFAFLGLASAIRADTVILDNGSRFDGTIVKETDDEIVLKLDSGQMKLKKARIKKIVRKEAAPPGPEAGGREADGTGGGAGGGTGAGTGSGGSGTPYLRGGWRIEGSITSEDGPWVTIRTAGGDATFSRLLLDRTGESRDEASRFRKFASLDDPALIDAALARREYNEAYRRSGFGSTPEELREEEQEVERLEAARDDRALEAIGRRIEDRIAGLDEFGRPGARKLAARACSAAGFIARSRATPEEGLLSARLYMRAQAVCPEQNLILAHTVRHEVRTSLDPVLKGDPRHWADAIRLLEETEDFTDWCDLGADWSWYIAKKEYTDKGGRWRWGDPVPGVEPGPTLPAMFRVIRAGGGEEVLKASPSTSDGFQSVWVPAIRRLGGPNIYGSAGLVSGSVNETVCWLRAFWCPVRKVWTDAGIPERLAAHRFSVHEAMKPRLVEDETAVRETEGHRAAWFRALDSLAYGVDPESGDWIRFDESRDRYQESLDALNKAYDGFVSGVDRIFRRRAALQPAFGRLREIDALAERAAKGEAVDLARLEELPAIPAK